MKKKLLTQEFKLLSAILFSLIVIVCLIPGNFSFQAHASQPYIRLTHLSSDLIGSKDLSATLPDLRNPASTSDRLHIHILSQENFKSQYATPKPEDIVEQEIVEDKVEYETEYTPEPVEYPADSLYAAVSPSYAPETYYEPPTEPEVSQTYVEPIVEEPSASQLSHYSLSAYVSDTPSDTGCIDFKGYSYFMAHNNTASGQLISNLKSGDVVEVNGTSYQIEGMDWAYAGQDVAEIDAKYPDRALFFTCSPANDGSEYMFYSTPLN